MSRNTDMVALRLIGLHQVAYEAVASVLQVQSSQVVYISFDTIVSNHHEPPAAAQAHIHVATHINGSQYSELYA